MDSAPCFQKKFKTWKGIEDGRHLISKAHLTLLISWATTLLSIKRHDIWPKKNQCQKSYRLSSRRKMYNKHKCNVPRNSNYLSALGSRWSRKSIQSNNGWYWFETCWFLIRIIEAQLGRVSVVLRNDTYFMSMITKKLQNYNKFYEKQTAVLSFNVYQHIIHNTNGTDVIHRKGK